MFPPPLDDLELASEALAVDLTRLRGARTTRGFDLEEVEGFFVYFYTLRTIAHELLKMRRHIADLEAAD